MCVCVCVYCWKFSYIGHWLESVNANPLAGGTSQAITELQILLVCVALSLSLSVRACVRFGCEREGLQYQL